MRTRREARECALKVLYAQELSGNPIGVSLTQLLPEGAPLRLESFVTELVQQTKANQIRIDALIKNHVEKWEMDRIAVLDRLILRLAICEIFFFSDIPPKVAINEAIEIAKKYSTEKSGKFVNGILDAILHQELLNEPKVSALTNGKPSPGTRS